MITVLKPVAVCPMCFGTGQSYSLKHTRMVTCTLCGGRRWVPSECCRACGRPAFAWWPIKQPPIVRYCGDKDCLEKLVKIHKVDSNAEVSDIRVDFRDVMAKTRGIVALGPMARC